MEPEWQHPIFKLVHFYIIYLNEHWKSSRRYKFLMNNENQVEDISS